MYLLLEETEKQAVRRALIEERSRFCTFITFLQPVVVGPYGSVALRHPTLGLAGVPSGAAIITSKNQDLGTTGHAPFFSNLF